jgi:hypothetical protein
MPPTFHEGDYSRELARLDQYRFESFQVLPEEPRVNELSFREISNQIDTSQVTFDLVSQGNCTSLPSGELTQCRFPKIELEHPELLMESLPFETKLFIQTKPACLGMVDPTISELKVTLYEFTNPSADYSSISAFHSEEWLNLAYTKSRVLRHSENLPFHRLRVSAQGKDHFLKARFPSGCKIQLTLDFNRIAIRRNLDAVAHMNRLNETHASLTALEKALRLLSETQLKGNESSSLIESFRGLFSTNENAVRRLTERWNQVQSLVQALNQKLASENDQETIRSMAVLLPVVRSTGTLVDQLKNSLSQNQGQSVPSDDLDQRIRNLQSNPEVQNLSGKITKFRLQMVLALSSLQYHLRHGEGRFIQEDLEDVLKQEISGPQGVLDLLRLNLRAITSDQSQ